MIHEVKIKNFQALHDVQLRLEPFTVIVGPSSVGKSSLMRALRTLTSNRRGADFISHGERVASITAVTDRGTVTLTRGRGNGAADNAYRVQTEDPEHLLYPERTYVKLGGDVPPEVSAFLGIEAKDPLNYAGQFDKPYLLDESAGEVARILGALTNVDIIFSAARESNRRKLATTQQLRIRAEDLQQVKNKIPTYRSLKQQSAALTSGEDILQQARQLEQQVSRLEHLIVQQETAARAVKALQPTAEASLPDPAAVVAALQHLEGLTAALRSRVQATAAVKEATTRLGAAESFSRGLESEQQEILGELTDSLAGWFGALLQQGDSQIIAEQRWIRFDAALRIMVSYLETKAVS